MNFQAIKAIYFFEMARTFRTLVQSINQIDKGNQLSKHFQLKIYL